jgi:RHS repeat-associated protein
VQQARGTEILHGFLAAHAQLKEKPRPGFATVNPAPNQGFDDSNSIAHIGLRASLALHAIKQSGRARYFSGAQGRFTSPDPVSGTVLHLINPQRWNMYAYALNNPLFYTDPDGRDAVAVNLSKQVFLAGHMGIVSVHRDGTATYGREGPATEGRPIGTNEVKTVGLPNVEFGSGGVPTAASYRSLADAIGKIEGQEPGSINLAYFKTSEADTLALNNFLRTKKSVSDQGSLFLYFGIGNNCADFCINGLSHCCPN